MAKATSLPIHKRIRTAKLPTIKDFKPVSGKFGQKIKAHKAPKPSKSY
jgi:hypothetical protein